MYEITSEIQFSAAHRLKNYSGPCENIHGHNWVVKATVRCLDLDKAGIGIDFKQLRLILKEIIQEFDHKDLNVVFEPIDLNPSSENIACHIYGKMRERLTDPGQSIARVEVCETPGNCAVYYE